MKSWCFSRRRFGLSLGRTFLICLGILCLTLVAVGSQATLSVDAAQAFAGGSGTEADPYLVATAAHLNSIRDHLDAYFRQTADIDLGVDPWNGGGGWSPIGDTATPFTGSFDGSGHAIRNLTINRPNSSHQGLFGTVSEAQLFNLHLQDVNLRTRSHSGALAGVIGFDSLIEKVTVTGAINGAPGQDVGGLAGAMNLSILHRVAVTATVQGGAATGGLFGVINGGEIRHSHSAGSVQGTQQVGGLVGYVGGTNTSIISDSYSRAAVSSGGSAGGLFGYLYGGIVERSYSAGPVSGAGDNVGGFIGQGAGTSVSDCYWDTQTSGQLTSSGGDGVMGRTTAQMQQQATYPRFNFAALWAMDAGSGYPVFQNLDRYAQPQPVDLADLAGNGSMQDPYLITNIHELNAMRQNLDASYWLTTDVDLADTVVWDYGRGWSPIGDTATPFTGNFDGGGHTLHNLAINRPNSSHQGLFGTVSEAQLFNLHLQDVNLQTRSHSGTLAGVIGFDSLIEKLTVTGAINGAPGQDVGGLAGAMNLSILHRVAVTATVEGGAATGGLFGAINGGEIRHSYSAGSVQGTQQVGGLVGYVSINTPIISDNYSRAAVSSGESAGGLIGQIKTGKVERSYSTGPVSGTGDNVGGFIGQGAGTSVSDCYWDTQTSGQLTSAGGDGVVGRTTAQMTSPHAADTYVEWDFQDIWKEDVAGTRNDGYPYLEPRGATGFSCGDVTEIPTAECQGLVTLYTATGGEDWTNKTDWLQTNTPCKWYGVSCSGGRVNWLSLYENRLAGALPPEISNLTALASLTLSNNQLTSLPPQIGNLTALTWLNLDRNQLTSVPSEIGNLTALTGLGLANNQLTNLPSTIGALSKVRWFGLSNNLLTGLPTQIGSLSALTELYVDGNQLTSLPQELGNLAELQYLHLHGNPLIGEVPQFLTNLPALGVGDWFFTSPFTFYDTGWCAPATGPVATWLAGIEYAGTGLICGQPAGGISGQATLATGGAAPGIQVALYRPLAGEGQGEQGQTWLAVASTLTGPDGGYAFGGLGQDIDYRVHFVDPAGQYASQYYDDNFFREQSTPVTVTLGQVRTGVDAVLRLPVPPTVGVETGGTVTFSPDGTVNITQWRGARTPIAITLPVTCTGGTMPTDVMLVMTPPGTNYPMTGSGSDLYQATIPAADVVAATLAVSYKCEAVAQETPVGRVTLYDPSGIITDAQSGQPVVGATVTLYKVPGWLPRTGPTDTRPNTCESNLSKAPGAAWSQPAPTTLGMIVNPDLAPISPQIAQQQTNEIGYYGWDVSEGCWYVRVTAPDYAPLTSPVVGVPPAVTDLDLVLAPVQEIYLPLVLR